MNLLTEDQIQSNLKAYEHAMRTNSFSHIEFRFSSRRRWKPKDRTGFGIETRYRIKPMPCAPKLRPWKACEVPVGKVIRNKKSKSTSMIIGYNPKDNEVHCYGSWFSTANLLEENEMLDGSPCGVYE